MSKNKSKKQIRLLKQYEGTIIDKYVKEEIKRIKRRYNKHRSKSQKICRIIAKKLRRSKLLETKI